MHNRRITNAYEFTKIPEHELVRFAHKNLAQLWAELNGTVIFPVTQGLPETPKSIMKTLSFFPHKKTAGELFPELVRNVQDACIKARRHNVVAYRARWFLKTATYRYHSYEINFDAPTSSPILILKKIRAQFDQIKFDGRAYKTTGVILTGLTPDRYVTRDLFGMHDQVHESNKLFDVVDNLAKKYGRHAVALASGLKAHLHDKSHHQSMYEHLPFFAKAKRMGKDMGIAYLGEVR